MAEQQARTTTSSGFANADAIIRNVEELAKDTTIAVPAVVVVSHSFYPHTGFHVQLMSGLVGINSSIDR